jgi:outer membrane protein assembly factor BamE (lipoprotein component of BamABCDE complex)
MKHRFFRSSSNGLVMMLVVVLLASCISRVETRGNLPDPERLAEIQPGSHSRDEVVEILGSPTSTAFLDGETWYYISEKTETVAFLAPEITERKVLVVQFDSEGVVSGVNTLGVEDGRQVEIVDRKTPTAGKKLTVMQQLFGNVGRFAK